MTQRFAGASDLDIPPANQEKFQPVGRIFVTAGSEIEWTLYPKPQPANSGEMHLVLVEPDNSKAMEQKVALDAKSQQGHYRASRTGYYGFQVKINGRPGGPDNVPYFLNVTYRGPQKLEGPR